MSWTSRGSSICSLRTVCSTASAVCLARRATGVSNWGDVVVWMGKLLPDVHRELYPTADLWYVRDGS